MQTNTQNQKNGQSSPNAIYSGASGRIAHRSLPLLIRIAVKPRLLVPFIVLMIGGLGVGGYVVVQKMMVTKHSPTSTNTTAGDSSTSTAKGESSTPQPAVSPTTPAAGGATSAAKVVTPSSQKASSGTSGGTTTTPTTPTTPTVPTTPVEPSGSCFAVPSNCGYPDATNTGPAPGTVFTKVPEQATSGNGWNWDSTYQYISVYGSNITLNGIETAGNIDITGSNVTLQNCKIIESNGMFGVSIRHTTNVTIKNCRIAGTNASSGRMMVGIKSIYDDDVNLRSIANNISYVSTGIQYCQGLIQDNYIHDMGYQSGDHLNGTTSNAGCNQLTIQHNTIFNSFSQTDAISLFEDFGQQKNALITNNYVAGGGYTIYGGANAGGITPTNVQVTGNRISDNYYANGGFYGWLAAWDGSGSGNACSGNVLEHVATGTTEALGC